MKHELKISCPNCAWEPDARPYWECHCGHVWNTFETAGRCPACQFQHNYTQCVAHAGGCTAFSLHVDWYQGMQEMVGALLHESLQRVEVPRNDRRKQP